MSPSPAPPATFRRSDPAQAALALVAGLTALRLAALFVSPVELYPDEAQYWLWSRELAFGYFSKPPMVAWLIALTTAVGGDAEPWVRFASPWLHGGAALVLFAVGRRLYGGWTGFWAAALYSLMPGVQLSAGLASTDAALLFFLALALWAYAALLQAPAGRGARTALGLGLALGAAFLSKYAALYLLLGLAAHLAVSRDARAAWRPGRIALAGLGFALAAAPNLIWNATHGFATVAHTAANANWSLASLFHPAEMAEFLLAQLAVFGPVPLVALAVGVGLGLRRRALTEPDRLLLCLVLPPLVLVTVQALLSRANANWAAAAYVPGAVLTAAWLVRWGARRVLILAVASQAALAALFLSAAAAPSLADAAGLGNAFKRARGWEETTARVLDAARAAAPVEAVAVDDRFLFNAMAYYGRDRLAEPGAPPLRMWVREAAAHNQAEAEAPLTPATRGRVLMASIEPRFRGEFAADFARTAPWRAAPVALDARRRRDLALAVGEGFAPRPRDPLTGLPPPP